MPRQKNSGRFEVDEDSKYQRIEWRTEHLGSIVWALIVVAALGGFLGSGPFSNTEAAASDRQLVIDYYRIDRRRADSEITVRIAPQLARDGAVRLRANAAFFETAALDRIEPEPREVLHGGAFVTHVFPVAAPTNPLFVRFRFRPIGMGRNEYVFGVEGGPELRLSTFVLP